MIKEKEFEIGGEKFTIQQFHTTDALKYGVKISKIIGAALAAGLKDDDDAGDILDMLDVGGMVEGFMSQIDEIETPALIKELLQKSLVSHQIWSVKANAKVYVTEWDDAWYETRFAGAMGDLLELLAAIFEMNFLHAIEAAKKKMEARRKSSLKSSGSGDGEPKEETESTP